MKLLASKHYLWKAYGDKKMRKRKLLLLLLFTMCSVLYGQQKELAEKLVGEGVALHDKGDYVGAMAKYDEALGLDKNNLYALAEKAMTLMVVQKPEEAIEICEVAIKEHKGSDLLYMVYVIYGNANDELGDGNRSIEVYDQGIKEFPDFYQLHFNKGITLLGMGRQEEAILSFQQSASLNPNHPGSHNAIGRTLYEGNRLIPSLLAFAMFFVLEPEGDRARENLVYVKDILERSANRADDNTINISVTAGVDKKGSTGADDFSSVELLLGLNTALDYDDKYKAETEVERFVRKFEMVCLGLSTQTDDNSGFYWEYYAPFFIEMKSKNQNETFGYIVFVSLGDKDILNWIESNEGRIIDFYKWVESYKWE